MRSLVYGGIATVLCLLLGYPLAYAIAFKAGRVAQPDAGAGHRAVLHQLPDPHAGLAADPRRPGLWWPIACETVHLLGADGRLLATPLAVVTGLTYNFLPFMVLPLYAALEKIDPRLIEAAGDLYASPIRGFFKVTWPLSLPGVVAGTLLTFIPAAGDYINAELLGNTETRMVGNVIQDLFTDAGDYPAAGCPVDDADDPDRRMVLVLRPPGRDGGSAVTALREASGTGSVERIVMIIGILVLIYMFIPMLSWSAMSFNVPAVAQRLPVRLVHLGQLDAPVRARGPVRGRCGRSIEIGLLATIGRDDPRDADGVRAGAAPLLPGARTPTCSSSCRWPRPRS